MIKSFRLSKYQDSEGQRIVEHDLFRIVEGFEGFPSKTGLIVYKDGKFYMCFDLGEEGINTINMIELEGNNYNIEVIGSRESLDEGGEVIES
jgi:hypothetical protein